VGLACIAMDSCFTCVGFVVVLCHQSAWGFWIQLPLTLPSRDTEAAPPVVP